MNAPLRAVLLGVSILAALTLSAAGVADAAAQAARSPDAGAQAAHPMDVAIDAPDTERSMRLSNKWRLQFSGAAESRGIMVLEVQPKGRVPVRVTVEIERNDGENRVARKVKTAIDRQAGDWVDAELDDGEDVLVKRRLFKPRVTVRLISSSVKDVRINFDRE